MSTGFLDAGIAVAAGLDVDRRAVEAYRYNHEHRGSRGIVADVSALSAADILSMSNVDTIDVVIGGPPCQPFSIVGKRRGRSDRRADLIYDFARIVSELKPAALFFENVPNFATMDNGRLLADLIAELHRSGYGIAHNVVSAADYGVPQNRRRLLLLGIMGRDSVTLPPATHGNAELPALHPYVTVGEALDDLPDAGDFGECCIYNHEPTLHTADMVARLSSLAAGQREKGSFHDRLHPDRLSYTLRAGTGNYSPLRPIHYRYDRVVTVRESARIQGFRDDFIWPDWIPRLQQYRQVGNAVPPPLAFAVARHLSHELGWHIDPVEMRGTPSSRPPAITLTDEQRRLRRQSKIRGASLGFGGRRDAIN